LICDLQWSHPSVRILLGSMDLSDQGTTNAGDSQRPSLTSFPNAPGGSQLPRVSKSELSYVQCAVDDLSESIETLSVLQLHQRQKNCCNLFIFNSSQWKFTRAARAVWKYCSRVSHHFESINAELQFPIFPERCGRLTHPAASIWILTFAIKEISGNLIPERDFASLSKAFTTLISEAELAKSVLNDVTPQLLKATSGAIETLRNSAAKLEARFIESILHRRQSVNRPELSVNQILLTGSKIDNEGLFHTLRLYMRTDANTRKWSRFTAYPMGSCLRVITEGLEKVTISLKIIREGVILLKRFLERPDSCCYTTIGTSTRKMSAALDRMLDNKIGLLSESLLRAGNTISKSGAVIYSLQLNCRKFALQIQEIEAMARLCYKFILEGLQIPLKPGAETIDLNLTRGDTEAVEEEEDDYENPERDFKTRDFFRTGYPDILRKVPVVINQNELCLQ